jgi:dipeptidyl aminopeptidase/acylaminoacyl peptidase
MRSVGYVILSVLLLVCSQGALFAQQIGLQTIIDEFEKNGTAEIAPFGVRLSRFDFKHGEDQVEAIAFRPMKDGKYPGALLIPGYSRTARDYIPLGVRLAREGLACVAITQRGFGKSSGEADFVGTETIAALDEGLNRFAKQAYVDSERLGIFGYSRGAIAASLIATSRKDLDAAVFAAGIYDLNKAYEEVTLAGIRENMDKETGGSEEAFRARSSIGRMENLNCPVLILHGAKDVNAPVEQAKMLGERLSELKKVHELKLFPDRDHDLGRQNLNEAVVAFLKRYLLENK